MSGDAFFHHTDASTPEESWTDHLHTGSRPELHLIGITHLMVVGAHPDDETLMAGGLITVAHRAGILIDVVVATDGEASHPRSPTHTPDDLIPLRRREVVAAVRRLAPSAIIHSLGLRDGDLTLGHAALVTALVALIGTGGASTLLVSTWRGDGHCDHEAAAVAAASAAWRTDAQFLEAPIWLWHWGSPGKPLPPGPALPLTADVAHAKAAAMSEHRSQVAALSDQPGDGPILSPSMLAHFSRGFEVFFDGVAGEENPFEALHTQQQDPWNVHSSFYESRKRALTMAALPVPHYERVLEVGCSIGALAADLAARASHVLAVDESAAALRQAVGALGHLPGVELAQLQVPEGLGVIDAD
ncbi:PIG-L family deacetylase, partial [Tessaracoccus sp.]